MTTLAVQLYAYAVCEIEEGYGLVIDVKNSVTVHYILSGEGTIRSGAKPEVAFGAHSILIAPAGQEHTLGAGAPEARKGVVTADECVMLADGLVRLAAGTGRGGVISICGSIHASYAGALGLFDALDQPIVAQTASDDPLRQFLQLLVLELSNPGLGSRACAESLMKLCLIRLLRQDLRRNGSNSPFFAGLHDRRLALVVAAILENPAHPHSVGSLAEIAGMSRSAFAQHFTRTFNRAPIEFLHSVRLRHAAHLLRTTDLSVKMICGAIGYASRSYFSRAFRSYYKMDPTTFRKMSTTAREEDLQATPDAFRLFDGM